MPIQQGILINGEWRKKRRNKSLAVRAPYKDKLLAYLSRADKKDVEEAIENARQTFEQKTLSPYRRFEILNRASLLLSQRKEATALTLCEESGKPIKAARTEVERAIQTLLISAEEAKRIQGEQIPLESAPGSEKRIAFTIREPLGVVCAISPFNFPLNLVAHKVAPALAAGNTVVLKPASATPLSAINLANILMEAGLPPGFLNIVFGSGNSVGEQLLVDPRFSLYSFTGSPEVGKRIREAVGLRRTILELGSNSAVIVHKDADLDKAVPACVRAAYAYAGQVCISLQRVYVHRDLAPEFLNGFQELTDRLKLGDPRKNATDLGPMINEQAAKRAEEWIKEAVASGAKLLCGGKRKKNFLSPAILTEVQPWMRVVGKEIFAPVVTVTEYSELTEAIALVNDSEYGLQAGIFTRDINTGFKAARQIRTGGILINDTPMYRADLMPYGGIKNSGMGREGPRYAIEEMTDLKLVIFNL